VRHDIALALALAGATLLPVAASAGPEFYYRNVGPGQGASAPQPGSGTGSGGGGAQQPDPVPDPEPETGPLTLTLNPAGPINASWSRAIEARFRAAGGCPGKRFALAGADPSVLAQFGLTAGPSGSDYVIAGKLDVVGPGGYNLTVTVSDDCGAQKSVSTWLYLNPGASDAPPSSWELRLDGTVAYAGQAFAFYPELHNTESSDAIDGRGYTYSLHTLDPANRPIPSWLAMPDPSTGVLLGRAPAAAGSYGPFYVTAKPPNGGLEQSADLTVKVNDAFTFDGPSAVALEVGVPYAHDFTGSGSCGGLDRYFEIDGGSPLPTGLALVSKNGKWGIAGTPEPGTTGSWPVRLSYWERECGFSQLFTVTFTVAGEPAAPLAFEGTPFLMPVKVGGNPDLQVLWTRLDQSGPPRGSLSCSLVNLDGTPANLPWATVYADQGYKCEANFDPTEDAQAGTYVVRMRATTTLRGQAETAPVTITVDPR